MKNFLTLLFLFFAIAVTSQEEGRSNALPEPQLNPSHPKVDFHRYESCLLYRHPQSVMFLQSRGYSSDFDWQMNRWKPKKLNPGIQLLFAIPFYLLGGDRTSGWEWGRSWRQFYGPYGVVPKELLH